MSGQICEWTNFDISYLYYGLFWWVRGKESVYQYRRPGFDAWVRKMPWRRKWQPTAVFLPGKSHGQRSLAGYNPCDCKESDMKQQQQQKISKNTGYHLSDCFQLSGSFVHSLQLVNLILWDISDKEVYFDNQPRFLIPSMPLKGTQQQQQY